jgi:hypothetical protein
MKRPDAVFTVIVCPAFYVFSCAEKLAQESRGLMGFHSYQSCPNCRIESKGFEYWGENGHKQGSSSNRAGMVFWVSRTARKQWRMQAGGIMGYRFRKGSPIYYAGGAA